MQVHILPARADNYMYLLVSAPGEALAVDPCDANLVRAALAREGLRLSAILATHHHGDHVAGIPELKQETGCTVYGPESQRIAGVDRVVRDGEELVWGALTLRVLSTPGHTRTSVCYAVNPSQTEPLLFSGDTLFIGGCGRLFECDGATMWQSLAKLQSLPAETRLYCGHEYTLENLAFAESITPGDSRVRQNVADMRQRIRTAGRSIPSTLEWERRTNIFLRAGEAAVKRAVGLEQASPAAVFTALRQRKDCF